ncbi:type-F conjugative transfer system pilin assembly thiol-disulfide isomerase TrbB [Providencia alcalifaciens]|uniref:type-F conjugative transfer system pilin assembly thiol-disulfide isomerase TrbB n=1 Tax=Providencia alcalifaciens TaxID=126385 RepID=UPI0032DADE06
MSAVVNASVLDEIKELEAHKGSTVIEQPSVIPEPPEPVVPIKPEARPYQLPNGKVVDLNDYTLVLFMQSQCPYCHQFDLQFALLLAQMGFKVFPLYLRRPRGYGLSQCDTGPARSRSNIFWGRIASVDTVGFFSGGQYVKNLPTVTRSHGYAGCGKSYSQ